MKKILGFLAFTLLIGCQQPKTFKTQKFKTMMIRADGMVETKPDLASFSVDLNCLKKSVKSSTACLVEKSNTLNDKLLSFGIDQDDILTTSVNRNKSYAWIKNKSVFQGYNSSTILHVTVRDINKLDDIYTELLENQNLNLGYLRYSHSMVDSLSNKAYVKALKNANNLAQKLLAELPEDEKEILKIGNVKITSSTPQDLNKYEDDMVIKEVVGNKNKSISISKGTVVVNATLFVEFQIK